MNSVIRRAEIEDTQSLVAFLKQVGLNTDGIAETIDSFLIMEDESGRIEATIGMEPFGDVGLLRSLVMTTQASENDLFLLFEQMFLLAKDKGMKEIFMATNKLGAMKLVELLGFQQVNKTDLPNVLCQSEHVQHILTVDNSEFLKLTF
ncbi:hypothetical protein JMM81_06400 [Bacillus sp. V3B]|uniref:GNAT family N-acetyltransferase n=1 Tax=Bacillus sp. V3B TaxID=2804915 RepID=UPI00210D09F2|nr:hypothetical protein [Bacillus sp. V3B]MCQ6274603.1 hypothetical protein [Bacillus sp. V3B]